MDSKIRKAAFIEARAESLEIFERTADIKVVNATEKWLSEQPDVVAQPAAFNKWLARQPDDGGQPGEPAGEIVEKPTTPTLTKADVDERIAEHRDIWLEVLSRAISHERKRVTGEIAKLQTTIDGLTLRLDAFSAGFTKATSLREADVIDLPALPMRGGRRA